MTEQEIQRRYDRLYYRPNFHVPRKFKKAWRQKVLADLKKNFPDYFRRVKLWWSRTAGWTITYRKSTRG